MTSSKYLNNKELVLLTVLVTTQSSIVFSRYIIPSGESIIDLSRFDKGYISYSELYTQTRNFLTNT